MPIFQRPPKPNGADTATPPSQGFNFCFQKLNSHISKLWSGIRDLNFDISEFKSGIRDFNSCIQKFKSGKPNLNF